MASSVTMCASQVLIKGHGLRILPVCKHMRRVKSKIAATDRADGRDDVGGDKRVQDELVQLLRSQINIHVSNQSLKDEVRQGMKQKQEELKKILEEKVIDEFNEEVDRERQLEMMRLDLSANSALSDAVRQFDELEEDIGWLKSQRKAREAEQQKFEAEAAEARSRGLFFKNLYRLKGGQPPEGALEVTRNAIQEPAEREVHSSFRLMLFSYMTLILALAIGQDLLGSTPAYGLDLLYAVMCFILAANAWAERQALPLTKSNSGPSEK